MWSILALGVWHCVDPSEKERARKETGDRVGRRGITDNILFNYCLNKNIVFLKERNQLKSNKHERKKMKSKLFFCKTKQRNKRRKTWMIQEKEKKDINDKTNSCNKIIIIIITMTKQKHKNKKERNQKHQKHTGASGSGQRKNERDNMCPYSDPRKPKLPQMRSRYSRPCGSLSIE